MHRKQHRGGRFVLCHAQMCFYVFESHAHVFCGLLAAPEPAEHRQALAQEARVVVDRLVCQFELIPARRGRGATSLALLPENNVHSRHATFLGNWRGVVCVHMRHTCQTHVPHNT